MEDFAVDCDEQHLRHPRRDVGFAQRGEEEREASRVFRIHAPLVRPVEPIEARGGLALGLAQERDRALQVGLVGRRLRVAERRDRVLDVVEGFVSAGGIPRVALARLAFAIADRLERGVERRGAGRDARGATRRGAW